MSILVEACVDSVASALAAERGGAGRIELCDNLFDGGTTPSAGMISAVKAAVRIPVFVIIRSRGGGFVYTDDEVSVMRLDVEAAKMLGADGIVVGALTRDARVDVELERRDGAPIPARVSIASFADGYATLLVSDLRPMQWPRLAVDALDSIRTSLEKLNQALAADAGARGALRDISEEINGLARMIDEMLDVESMGTPRK